MDDSYQKILRENEQLKRKLAGTETILRLQRTLGTALGQLGLLVVCGPRLVVSLQSWLQAFLVSPVAMPIEETAQLGAAVIRRMLAVGLIGAVVAALPIILLYQQNTLIREQSRLVGVQNTVAEATRRSALVFELTDILNEVDEELDQNGLETTAAVSVYLDRSSMTRVMAESIEDDGKRPRQDRRSLSTPRPLFRLSTRLTGRIVALSRALRPYAYLDNDGQPIARPLSPERGQLLLSLVYSGVDMEDLNHEEPWFHDADLLGANLSKVDLTHIKLQRANLRDADLSGAILEYARIDGADLRGANLLGTHGLDVSSFVSHDGSPAAIWDEKTQFPPDIKTMLAGQGLQGCGKL